MAEKSLTDSLEGLGERPSILKGLALINMAKANYDSARIYLGALSKTLFHDDWANNYLELLKSAKLKFTFTYLTDEVTSESYIGHYFSDYENIISTDFDMTKDTYSFDNSEWPGRGKCYGMAAIYMCEKPEVCYNPNCDLNDDGIINIFDIVEACSHYQDSW